MSTATATPIDKNIGPPTSGALGWTPADPHRSIADALNYVESAANDSMNWYWRNKRWKSRLSRSIQLSAILLTAMGGIAPVIVQIFKNSGKMTGFDSGPIASLGVGLAAGLIGLDKAFGFSSGWARYVLTATNIRKALDEFRLDWMELAANHGSTDAPNEEQLQMLFQRLKDFSSTVQAMVLQETKDWVSEFQSNMAQVEKDVKAEFDTLKSRMESQNPATKPGSIELTVTNASKADGFRFQVKLESEAGVLTDETVINSTTWVRINASPRQYKMTVIAIANGSPLVTAIVTEVKPGEIAKPSVTLPIS